MYDIINYKYNYEITDRRENRYGQVSYNKLWKLLIDKGMYKYELKNKAKISGYNIAKLSNDENVIIDTVARVCLALNCSFDDIVEITGEEIPAKHRHQKQEQ